MTVLCSVQIKLAIAALLHWEINFLHVLLFASHIVNDAEDLGTSIML